MLNFFLKEAGQLGTYLYGTFKLPKLDAWSPDSKFGKQAELRQVYPWHTTEKRVFAFQVPVPILTLQLEVITRRERESCEALSARKSVRHDGSQ